MPRGIVWKGKCFSWSQSGSQKIKQALEDGQVWCSVNDLMPEHHPVETGIPADFMLLFFPY